MGRLVLMSTRPGVAPDLQLLSNPDARHVAFRVDTLAELRERTPPPSGTVYGCCSASTTGRR